MSAQVQAKVQQKVQKKSDIETTIPDFKQRLADAQRRCKSQSFPIVEQRSKTPAKRNQDREEKRSIYTVLVNKQKQRPTVNFTVDIPSVSRPSANSYTEQDQSSHPISLNETHLYDADDEDNKYPDDNEKSTMINHVVNKLGDLKKKEKECQDAYESETPFDFSGLESQIHNLDIDVNLTQKAIQQSLQNSSANFKQQQKKKEAHNQWLIEKAGREIQSINEMTARRCKVLAEKSKQECEKLKKQYGL